MIHGLIRCHVERVFDASYIGFVGTCYVKVRRLNKDGTNRGYVTDLWCTVVGEDVHDIAIGYIWDDGVNYHISARLPEVDSL